MIRMEAIPAHFAQLSLERRSYSFLLSECRLRCGARLQLLLVAVHLRLQLALLVRQLVLLLDHFLQRGFYLFVRRLQKRQQ